MTLDFSQLVNIITTAQRQSLKSIEVESDADRRKALAEGSGIALGSIMCNVATQLFPDNLPMQDHFMGSIMCNVATQLFPDNLPMQDHFIDEMVTISSRVVRNSIFPFTKEEKV